MWLHDNGQFWCGCSLQGNLCTKQFMFFFYIFSCFVVKFKPGNSADFLNLEKKNQSILISTVISWLVIKAYFPVVFRFSHLLRVLNHCALKWQLNSIFVLSLESPYVNIKFGRHLDQSTTSTMVSLCKKTTKHIQEKLYETT